jgi:sugar lactone lactonase YvrE
VSAYGADQLSVSGTPAPRVVLSSNNGSLVLPVGLAFDAEGSLWVVNGGGVLARFGPGKLAVSGRPPADALLELPGQSLLWSAAFWPRPAGLPLAQN